MSAAKMVADSTISDLPVATKKRKKSSVKKKAKKQKKEGSRKHFKKEEDDDDSDLDLTKELKPLGEYISERQDLLDHLFHCVRGPSLERTLPVLLKELSLNELKQRCLEQLEIMSRKRIRRILEGDDPADISSSGTEDSTEGDNQDQQSSPTSDKNAEDALVETENRSSSIEYSDEEPTYVENPVISEVETDSNQSEEEGELQEEDNGHPTTEVSKKIQTETEPGGTPTVGSVGPVLTQNQMELLELEMRARAIKAMLNSQGSKNETEAATDTKTSPKDIQLTVGSKLQRTPTGTTTSAENIQKGKTLKSQGSKNETESPTDTRTSAENIQLSVGSKLKGKTSKSQGSKNETETPTDSKTPAKDIQLTVGSKLQGKNQKKDNDINISKQEATKTSKINVGRENILVMPTLHKKHTRGIGATTKQHAEKTVNSKVSELEKNSTKVSSSKVTSYSASSRHRSFRGKRKDIISSEKKSSTVTSNKQNVDHEMPSANTETLIVKKIKKHPKSTSEEDPAIVAMLRAKERAEREKIKDISEVEKLAKRKRLPVCEAIDESLLKKHRVSESAVTDEVMRDIYDVTDKSDEETIEEGEVTENDFSKPKQKIENTSSVQLMQEGTDSEKLVKIKQCEAQESKSEFLDINKTNETGLCCIDSETGVNDKLEEVVNKSRNLQEEETIDRGTLSEMEVIESDSQIAKLCDSEQHDESFQQRKIKKADSSRNSQSDDEHVICGDDGTLKSRNEKRTKDKVSYSEMKEDEKSENRDIQLNPCGDQQNVKSKDNDKQVDQVGKYKDIDQDEKRESVSSASDVQDENKDENHQKDQTETKSGSGLSISNQRGKQSEYSQRDEEERKPEFEISVSNTGEQNDKSEDKDEQADQEKAENGSGSSISHQQREKSKINGVKSKSGLNVIDRQNEDQGKQLNLAGRSDLGSVVSDREDDKFEDKGSEMTETKSDSRSSIISRESEKSEGEDSEINGEETKIESESGGSSQQGEKSKDQNRKIKGKERKNEFGSSISNQQDEKCEDKNNEKNQGETKSESESGDSNQTDEKSENEDNEINEEKAKSESGSNDSDQEDEKSEDEDSEINEEKAKSESGSNVSNQEDEKSEDEDSEMNEEKAKSESGSNVSDQEDEKSEDEDSEMNAEKVKSESGSNVSDQEDEKSEDEGSEINEEKAKSESGSNVSDEEDEKSEDEDSEINEEKVQSES